MDDGFMTGYVAGQNESNSGSGCGAWGDQWIWIIVVFALLFGWGNNGWGGNGGGNTMSYLPYAIAGSGALTRADLCQDMNFQGLENGVRNVSDAVNLGFANLNSTICNQQYETAGLINGLQGTIQGGFNAANIVALQNQNATQAQLAQCCCDERAAIADLKYTISTEDCATRTLIQNTTRDLIENQNAGVRSILDYLCQEKISDLQSEIRLFACPLLRLRRISISFPSFAHRRILRLLYLIRTLAHTAIKGLVIAADMDAAVIV